MRRFSMNKRIFLVLLFVFMTISFAGCNEKKELDLTVMSYNILYSFPNESYDSWKERKVQIANIIKAHNPDLIGLQEPFPWQVYDLVKLCPEYAAAKITGIHTDSSILYKKDKFAKLRQGHYWLSPKPEIPYSTGFGNFLPRYVIWARLYHLDTGREFYFINTHFDNTSPFQETAAPMFLEHTAELAAELPVIISGDFNSTIGTKAFDILTDKSSAFYLTDAYQASETHQIFNCTGDDCDDSTHDGGEGQIDHIFFAGSGITCSEWGVDKFTFGDMQRPPSDHYSIVSKIKIPAEKIPQ